MSNEKDSTDKDDYPEPIKNAPLKEMGKRETNMRIGADANELMIAKLEHLAEALWLEAENKAKEDGRSTIKEEDVQKAYDDFMEPYDFIEKVANDMEWMQDQMERHAKRSILYAPVEDDL